MSTRRGALRRSRPRMRGRRWRMRRGPRTAGALGAAALAVSMLGGCQQVPVGCPAIGWINELTVEVVEGPAGLAAVELDCDDCGLVRLRDSSLTSAGSGSWTFGVGMSTPEAAGVAMLDDAGALLAERRVEPEWERVGGTERCGGPAEAHVTVHG